MIQRPSASLILRASIIVSVIALVAAFASDVIRQAKIPELPNGCDQFGYLRQARLFQEHGWRGGLNTALENPQTSYLVEQAFALGGEPGVFAHGVAPHCHHYDARSGRVILQYPPGVGWLLSLFPEGVQMRWTFAFAGLAVLALLVPAAVTASHPLVPLIAALLGLIVFRALNLFAGEYSIVPSLGAAMLLGWLTVAAATSESRWRVVNFALLGFGFGLATALRLPNLFLAVGAGLVLALAFVARPSRQAALVAGVFGACALIGLAPVLAANAINAGHPLNTTYGAGDTSPPLLTWQALRDGFVYYFHERATPASFVWAGSAGLVALAFAARRSQTAGVRSACVMGAVAFAVNAVYFASHRPIVHYYMVSAAVYAMSVAGFGLIKLAAAPQATAFSRGQKIAGHAVAALAAIAVVAAVQRPGPDPQTRRVTAPIEPQAIVWADNYSGAFSYSLRRQAAVLPFIISEPLQTRMLKKIDADDIPQYLVADTAEMADEAARLTAFARLVPVGNAFGSPVYRIDVRP